MHLSDSFKEMQHPGLSKFFVQIAQSLINASNRADSTEKNLRLAAYNSLSSLIYVAGHENVKAILDISNFLLQNLGSSLSMKALSIEDQLNISDLQSFICSFLMVKHLKY